MSFLAIDEIRGKTSGTPTDVNNLKYQLATAWVNFNGTGTVAIRDSYNVSSITDSGASGDYTVNFATAMDNADYCFTYCLGTEGTTYTSLRGIIQDATGPTVNSARFRCRETDTNVLSDMPSVNITFFGGLN